MQILKKSNRIFGRWQDVISQHPTPCRLHPECFKDAIAKKNANFSRLYHNLDSASRAALNAAVCRITDASSVRSPPFLLFRPPDPSWLVAHTTTYVPTDTYRMRAYAGQHAHRPVCPGVCVCALPGMQARARGRMHLSFAHRAPQPSDSCAHRAEHARRIPHAPVRIRARVRRRPTLPLMPRLVPTRPRTLSQATVVPRASMQSRWLFPTQTCVPCTAIWTSTRTSWTSTDLQ